MELPPVVLKGWPVKVVPLILPETRVLFLPEDWYIMKNLAVLANKISETASL